MKFVILGLAMSSSWGNGHATVWRAIAKGLAQLGHEALFLERSQPWYRANQDLSDPWYCQLAFYDDPAEIRRTWRRQIEDADLAIIGSYTPEGVRVLDAVLDVARGPVGFYDLDAPITFSDLRGGRATYIAPRQVPQLHRYFSFAGGPLLQALRENFGAKAEALYCCADPEIYRPTGETKVWDLGYLGTYSADRQRMLERLLIEPARRMPHRRFVVAGPQYPADIAWPDNVERIEHLPPHEHPSFYSRQRFTLNVTRADMARAGWSPSVRIFEAACCGCAIVSDPWPGLDEAFAIGSEILVSASSDEIVRLIESDDMQEIGARARRRAIRDHAGLNRARKLVAAAEDWRDEKAESKRGKQPA